MQYLGLYYIGFGPQNVFGLEIYSFFNIRQRCIPSGEETDPRGVGMEQIGLVEIKRIFLVNHLN